MPGPDKEEELEDKYLNKIFGFTDEIPPPPLRDVNHVSVIPRKNGKNFAVDLTVMRNPGDRSITIAGMKISEEEFYNVHKTLGGDEDTTIDHFMRQAHKQRRLSRYYGDGQQRHGSSRFNPPMKRQLGKSLLMSRFLNMDSAEQDVVLLLAEKIRDTYMPHHQGRGMEPWHEMDTERQIKWIEMAVVAIRELDKLGLMIS